MKTMNDIILEHKIIFYDDAKTFEHNGYMVTLTELFGRHGYIIRDPNQRVEGTRHRKEYNKMVAYKPIQYEQVIDCMIDAMVECTPGCKYE